MIEDTFKGLACGLVRPKSSGPKSIFTIHLQLIGVATHPEKRQSLAEYTTWIVKDLNAISWDSILVRNN